MSLASSNTSLPTQAEFVGNGLVTGPIPDNKTCSICIGVCEDGQDVVRLTPCERCYFHRSCIVAWFESTHERCGTCPNDRSVLFGPDRNSTQPAQMDANFMARIRPALPALMNDRSITAEAIVSYISLHVAEESVTAALSSHNDFVRLQEEAQTDEYVIAAWQNAHDSGVIRSVRVGFTIMRHQSLNLPVDVLERFDRAAQASEDDYNRLSARCVSSIRNVLHTRMARLHSRLDRIRQQQNNQDRHHSVAYGADRIKSQIRELLQTAENENWYFVCNLLEDADWLEQQTTSYERHLTERNELIEILRRELALHRGE